MKKIIPHIFILILSLGIFVTSAVKVEAQVGTCKIPGGWPTMQLTYENCRAQGGDWEGNSILTSTCSPRVANVGDVICRIGAIIKAIIPVLVGLGVVIFVWGVVQYIIGGGDEAKKEGKARMIFGIIGLTVIIGMWGLVGIMISTFDLQASAPTSSPLTGAQATCDLAGKPKLQDLLCYITRILNDAVVPLIFAIATVIFIWGVVQYVISGADEEKKKKGRDFMIWGIIGLTVMIVFWGLVAILGETFFGPGGGRVIPQVHP